MTETQEKAIAALKGQQSKYPQESAVWYAGYQLIGICMREPASAEILLADLANPEMDIAHAEKRIHALADKYHKESRNSMVGVSDVAAEKVLRKFYGLPEIQGSDYAYIDVYESLKAGESEQPHERKLLSVFDL